MLAKLSQRMGVGRAAPNAPQEVAHAGTFRASSDLRDAVRTARPTIELLRQHALTSAVTELVSILFSFTPK